MLLVVGANGQLGSELYRLLGDEAIYVDRDKLDITDEDAVREFFSENRFDFIINGAAYTAVDMAEDDFEAADSVNRRGAELLAKYGRRIVHISTDYVFDGRKNIPYTEDDAVFPLSVYGATKHAGEVAVLREAETAVIIRTAWMFSCMGRNFVKNIRAQGVKQPQLRVVADQMGTPTYAADLAAAIVAILPQIKDGTKEIYHYSNKGATTWYDLAVAVMEESGLACEVMPLKSEEYPTRAKRPAYSVLDTAKIIRDFGLDIPSWRDGLKRCIAELDKQA